jgi:hypothetical protein
MATEPESYWGTSFADASRSAPKSILVEQAQILGRLTGNRIVADVTQTTLSSDFAIYLALHVPAMDYKYNLLTVTHGVEMYPLRLISHANPGGHEQVCASDGEFRVALKRTLGSEKTKQIIESLMAQAAA